MLLDDGEWAGELPVVAELEDDHPRELRDHHEGGRPRCRFFVHPGKGVLVVSTCLRMARSINRQMRSAKSNMRPKASMRAGFFKRDYS